MPFDASVTCPVSPVIATAGLGLPSNPQPFVVNIAPQNSAVSAMANATRRSIVP